MKTVILFLAVLYVTRGLPRPLSTNDKAASRRQGVDYGYSESASSPYTSNQATGYSSDPSEATQQSSYQSWSDPAQSSSPEQQSTNQNTAVAQSSSQDTTTLSSYGQPQSAQTQPDPATETQTQSSETSPSIQTASQASNSNSSIPSEQASQLPDSSSTGTQISPAQTPGNEDAFASAAQASASSSEAQSSQTSQNQSATSSSPQRTSTQTAAQSPTQIQTVQDASNQTQISPSTPNQSQGISSTASQSQNLSSTVTQSQASSPTDQSHASSPIPSQLEDISSTASQSQALSATPNQSQGTSATASQSQTYNNNNNSSYSYANPSQPYNAQGSTSDNAQYQIENVTSKSGSHSPGNLSTNGVSDSNNPNDGKTSLAVNKEATVNGNHATTYLELPKNLHKPAIVKYQVQIAPKTKGVPIDQEIAIMPPQGSAGERKPLVLLKQVVTKPTDERIQVIVPKEESGQIITPKVEVRGGHVDQEALNNERKTEGPTEDKVQSQLSLQAQDKTQSQSSYQGQNLYPGQSQDQTPYQVQSGSQYQAQDVCGDHIACENYNPNMCNQKWMKRHCRKMCGLCTPQDDTSFSNSLTLNKEDTTPKHCEYSGVVHQSGETWSPGPCVPKCHCDGGRIKCSKLECPDLNCDKPVKRHWKCCPECLPDSNTEKRCGVDTTGGNGESLCCVFPFNYNGVDYFTCTTADAEKPWCSITRNYDRDRLWGTCIAKSKTGGKHTKPADPDEKTALVLATQLSDARKWRNSTNKQVTDALKNVSSPLSAAQLDKLNDSPSGYNGTSAASALWTANNSSTPYQNSRAVSDSYMQNQTAVSGPSNYSSSQSNANQVYQNGSGSFYNISDQADASDAYQNGTNAAKNKSIDVELTKGYQNALNSLHNNSEQAGADKLQQNDSRTSYSSADQAESYRNAAINSTQVNAFANASKGLTDTAAYPSNYTSQGTSQNTSSSTTSSSTTSSPSTVSWNSSSQRLSDASYNLSSSYDQTTTNSYQSTPRYDYNSSESNGGYSNSSVQKSPGSNVEQSTVAGSTTIAANASRNDLYDSYYGTSDNPSNGYAVQSGTAKDTTDNTVPNGIENQTSYEMNPDASTAQYGSSQPSST